MNKPEKRPILKDLLPAELEDLFISLGLRPYRSKQVLAWIYKHLATSFAEMTSISKEDQRLLDDKTICILNLIPFNPFPGAGYDPPEENALLRFQEILLAHRYTATIRKSRGGEIMAACGQLTSHALQKA